jgi:hypothetical protein
MPISAALGTRAEILVEEEVGAKAGEAGNRIREVSVRFLGELLPVPLRRNLVEDLQHPVRTDRFEPLDRLHVTMHPEHRLKRGAQVQVRRTGVHHPLEERIEPGHGPSGVRGGGNSRGIILS